MNLGNLSRLSNAETRSICPENLTGSKGEAAKAKVGLPATRNENNASWAARDLGDGWKVNPGSAFNCYWQMPFRKKCKITMENVNPKDPMTLYMDGDKKTPTICSTGLVQVIRPDGTYRSQERFGLYRWHFDGRYLVQHSDIAATTFWYQAEPHTAFDALPGWETLENY